MRYINIFILCLLLTPSAIWAGHGPAGIGTTDGNSSLVLWLSADRNVTTNSNGYVTNWGDRSGSDIDASAGTAPDFLDANTSSIANKPTIKFDGGNNEYLDLSDAVPTGSNGEVTVFIVFKPNTTNYTSYETLLASQNTGASEGIIALGDYLSSTSSETLTFSKQTTSSPSGHYHDKSIGNSSFLIHNFDFDGSGNANYYQKNTSANLNANNGGFSSSSLGNLQRIGADANASSHFSGEIAEIIIFSRQLGSQERDLVANYLDAKYQLNELSSSDYFNNSGSHNYKPTGVTQNKSNSKDAGGLDIKDFNNDLGAGNYVFTAHENSNGVNTTSSPNRWKRTWKIDFSSNKKNNEIRLTFDDDDYVGGNIPTGAKKNEYALRESANSDFTPNNRVTKATSINAATNEVIFEVKFQKLESGNYYTLANANNQTAPLPVEWQYFKGEARAQGNVLKWGTASETNARHFQVQRSGSDKEDFQTIATIPAAGTTIEPQDYRYTDAVNQTQTHYYRLKQVDFDGSFEYSNVIALGEGPSAPAEAELELSRNPVPQGQPIRYRFAHTRQQPVTVKLYDARGQQRHSQQLSGDQGARALRADDLSPGVYWLRVAFGQKTISRKVVIY